MSADVQKIATRFGCNAVRNAKCLDLARMAAARGVVGNATVGLADIVRVVLRRQLPKDSSVRLSKWSSAQLTEAQQTYAALDVSEPLAAYYVLADKPDLTTRLPPTEAIPQRQITIVPKTGNVGVMASVAGTGKIESHAGLGLTGSGDHRHHYWEPPWGHIVPKKVTLTPNRQLRLVKVHRVFAPGVVVPFLRHGGGQGGGGREGRKVTLGDLAQLHCAAMKNAFKLEESAVPVEEREEVKRDHLTKIAAMESGAVIDSS